MSQLASPIVKAGKMMWNEIVKANWMRDNKRASTSIARSSLGFPVCRAARAGATGFSNRPQAGAQPRQRLELDRVVAAEHPHSRVAVVGEAAHPLLVGEPGVAVRLHHALVAREPRRRARD